MAGVKYGSLVGTAPRFVAPASGYSLSLGWSNDRSALTHIPAPLQPPKIFSWKVLWVFFPVALSKKWKKDISLQNICSSAPGLCLTLSGHFPFCPSFFGFGHLHSGNFAFSVSAFTFHAFLLGCHPK